MKALLNKYFLLILTSSMLTTPAFASIDFDAGMTAYNKGNMQTAKVMFQKAIALNKNDANAHYMYAQVLTKEKKYDLAKQEYKKVISIAPNSQAATYSKQGLEAINSYLNNKNQTTQKTSTTKTAASKTTKTTKTTTAKTTASKKSSELDKLDNAPHYLKNAYRLGEKYTRQKGTVRVYIENSKYKAMMKRAYGEWQSAIGGSVFFTFVENTNDASDIVKFSKMKVTGNAQEGGHCSYNIENGNLVGNTIVINTTGPDGKPLSNEMIYHTMLHEVGHSIGIMGHSTNRSDIMATGTKTPVAHLSARDRKTARLLYQGYTSSSNNVSKQAALNAKKTELEDIAKRIKNHPSAYVDLGDLAFEQGDYAKALLNYQQAEAMSKDKNIYNRIVRVYEKTGDVDNQVVYNKKILAQYPSDEGALRKILAIYTRQMRFKDGQDLLNDFIKKNPDKANTESVNQLKEIFSDKNVKALQNRQKFIMNKRSRYFYGR